MSSISVGTLKHIHEIISHALVNRINNSLLYGTFPDSIKIAKVIPISKSGDPSDINN